ncbi:MAG: sigma-70 family RNA polymerase sigma factor, partial [Limnobacter sp.]
TAKNLLVTQGRRPSTLKESNDVDGETFEDNAALSNIDTPESLYQTKQIGEAVNEAMAELPEELRSAIVMREIDGLSYEEIAEALDCPIGTVRSRFFRGGECVAAKIKR